MLALISEILWERWLDPQVITATAFPSVKIGRISINKMWQYYSYRKNNLDNDRLAPGDLPDLLLSPRDIPFAGRALRYRSVPLGACPLLTPGVSSGQVPGPLLSDVPVGRAPVMSEPIHAGLRHSVSFTLGGIAVARPAFLVAAGTRHTYWVATRSFRFGASGASTGVL